MDSSRLYCLDEGRTLLARAEELSRFTLAAKTFAIDEAGDASGRLFALVREYPGNRTPLHVELGGEELAALDSDPERQGGWGWAELPVPDGALSAGENHFTFRAEGSAADSWSLAVSCEAPRGASARSADGGGSWPPNSLLGYDCTLGGEYVARLLVTPAKHPDSSAAPRFVYEKEDHPRLAAMREEFALKKLCRGAKTDLERAGRVMSWWAGSWTYAKKCGPVYSPWDPPTVISWKNRGWGAGSEKPLAYCVHSASCLTLLLRAAGMWARSVVTDSENPRGTGGHFLTELFCRDSGRWVVLDPHFDAVLTLDGEPAPALAFQEVCERDECSRLGFEPGESYGGNPRCAEKWLERWLAGQGFWELGYYERGDTASHPELIPPEHGRSVYHEACFLWLDTERTPHRPYFPRWTRDRDALLAAPEGAA
ncbi:MAG: transglutaminase-like domain-containing protein [Planctomycetota bacterium]